VRESTNQIVIEDKPLTVAEVALILGVSRVHIYQLCQEKKFPHTRIGGRISITRKQLEEYRVANTVSVVPNPDTAP